MEERVQARVSGFVELCLECRSVDRWIDAFFRSRKEGHKKGSHGLFSFLMVAAAKGSLRCGFLALSSLFFVRPFFVPKNGKVRVVGRCEGRSTSLEVFCHVFRLFFRSRCFFLSFSS